MLNLIGNVNVKCELDVTFSSSCKEAPSRVTVKVQILLCCFKGLFTLAFALTTSMFALNFNVMLINGHPKAKGRDSNSLRFCLHHHRYVKLER